MIIGMNMVKGLPCPSAGAAMANIENVVFIVMLSLRAAPAAHAGGEIPP